MSDYIYEYGDVCGCGYDYDYDYEYEEVFLILIDENGNDVEMVLVEMFDVENYVYVFLLECNNFEVDGIILCMEEEDEEMVFYNIEDEVEWNCVEVVYNEFVVG